MIPLYLYKIYSVSINITCLVVTLLYCIKITYHCLVGSSQRRQWHPTPVLLPGKSHGWRSLEGCSPWGHWGSDTTEWLHFPFSLSCIGEGNGNPLQCSCLENPRDRGALWAAVYGVTQSRTRLMQLSSSSGIIIFPVQVRCRTLTFFYVSLNYIYYTYDLIF